MPRHIGAAQTKSIALIDSGESQVRIGSNLMVPNPYPRETASAPDLQLLTNNLEWTGTAKGVRCPQEMLGFTLKIFL